MMNEQLETVIAYHERTKHHPTRYARSAGYMDWATQPDPFRRFPGTQRTALDLATAGTDPSYDALFRGTVPSSKGLSFATISRLFQDSLALSAWKQSGESRWSLRVNPSSGALHPTEGYLIAGPLAGLSDLAGVYHYCAFDHVLERRRILPEPVWKRLSANLPPHGFFVALTTIYWRESWKYGERAFRYCNHDVGHAVAALALAAAADGFSVRLLTTISDDVLGALCGTAQQSGIEAEHPDLLLAVYPSDSVVEPNALGELKEWAEMFPLDRVEGVAKPLSRGHHNWPVIDEVSASTRVAEIHTEPCWNFPNRSESWTDRAMGARQIVRQRRSAVDMDGETSLSSESFYRVLDRLMPNEVHPVLRLWPWAPAVSLVLFVHRVDGLTPGLYLLVRDPEHEQSLRAQIDARLVWQRPENCPESLLLYRLAAAHVQDAARTISCGQDIAADGVFAVGMLAQMRSTLQTRGAWFYPRLFWETGMIGQMLYLEAEAAGVRGTGIGCFLDDLMHKILGLNPQGDWQSLYHFTVGGALEDTRIQTLDPYFHRNPAE